MVTGITSTFDQCNYLVNLYVKTYPNPNSNVKPPKEDGLRKFKFTTDSLIISRYLMLVYHAVVSFFDSQYYFFGRDASSVVIGPMLYLISYFIDLRNI